MSAARPARVTALLCFLVLSTAPTHGCRKNSSPTKRPRSKPNVILISIDTLRADHLPMYGYQRDTAPNLSSLSKDAVLFDQAYAGQVNTAPSHASMLTGLYPSQHGIRRNAMSLREDVPTLASILGEQGYATGAFVSGWTLRKHTKLDRGFDTYDDDFSPQRWERAGDRTYEAARQWVSSIGRDKPFFLFLHLFDPHYPYFPPRHYAMRFLPSGSKVRNRGYNGVPGYGWQLLSDRARSELVARYDGEIALADEQVGRLLTLLRRRGIARDTVIVFTSDHGETLFERDCGVEHGARPYDEQVHVPLMIRFPKGAAAGKRIAAQVHHVDLLPTLLEWLKLPAVKAATGRSLMPLIQGTGAWDEPRPVFSNATPRPNRLRRLEHEAALVKTGLVASIRLPDVKLIEYPTEDGGWYRELFLLESDPQEDTNVSDQHPVLSDTLHEQLERWRASGSDSAPPPPTEIPEDLKEGLRALGYAE